MVLTREQYERFWNEGYLVVEDAVSQPQLAALNAELDRWIEESRSHSGNFGQTIDGKPRFDVEPGHSAERPRLRRVSNPIEISEPYRAVLFESNIVDMVADLIGPNVKFHHCKINVKLPQSTQKVGWHQDHPYDPHTNDDVVVALLMLSDLTLENGCVKVVPGSHRSERYTLYRGDRYVGEIAADHLPAIEARAVPVTARARSVCLQHTWMVHGSAGNATDRPRALLICDYTAADAFPLTPPAVPSSLTGTIVRGQATRFARLTAQTLELPSTYQQASFFALQAEGNEAAE